MYWLRDRHIRFDRTIAIMSTRSRFVTVLVGAALVGASCGGDDDAIADSPSTEEAAPAAEAGAAPSGLVTVSPEQGAATIADAPEGLVILDVRTPEEFAEGHVDGAVMLDFYEPGFAAELAALDPTVPYVLYCRSGNRSGQTLAMMEELGFESVEDIGGGIVAWEAAGLPVTTD